MPARPRKVFAHHFRALLAMALGWVLFSCGAEMSSGPEGDECPSGLSQCGTACVDLSNHATSCGECGLSCAPGQSCQNGVCQCSAGLSPCSGACVEIASDAAHCGACGVVCASGQVCSQGRC